MAKLTEKTLATAITVNTLIHIVNTGDTTQSAYGSSYKAELSQLVPLFGSNPDITVTGGTYNTSTGVVTFYNNTGGTFNVSGFITGFTDSFVSGGTYSSGTATFTNTTGGTFTVTGFTNPFTGGSSNCITDLYVTNIHSCSPLNINPSDEGNVYFGSTSALTIDLTNNWVGIGTSVPSVLLDVIGTNETNYFRFDPDENGGRVTLSGETGLPSFLVRIPGYLTNPDAATLLGMVTWDNSFTNLGKNGDSFLLSTTYSNGLNIISENGITSEDYIRFYAGKNASSGNTPDIHIQGTGTTKGYVGIGISSPSAKLHINNTGVTDSFLVEDATNPDSSPFVIDASGNTGIGKTVPSEKLDVSGKTKTINFQMTSGATNGYVLTSDASGNASWQASSGGGSSINSYNNAGNTGTTLVWDVSGVSTNFKATLTGNTTLNLTNVRNGEYGTLIVMQDAVGSRSITFGTVNGSGSTHKVVNGGGGTPALTSNANAIDIVTFTYDGSIMYWNVGNYYT